MGDENEFSKGYLKGYKEGLIEAWDELIKLAGKGYTPRELQIMIKSSRPLLDEKVDQKIAAIEKALGKRIFTEQSPTERKGESQLDLIPGMSVLFKEERPEKGPTAVSSISKGGSKLLSISRMHPDQLKGRYGFEGSMIWLTKSEYSRNEESAEHIEFVSPNSLPVLAEAIQQFLYSHTGGVVFLEGLEYLSTQNDFKSVLKFVQLINEQVLLKKGFLVLSVNPSTMDQREFSLIEREMSQVT